MKVVVAMDSFKGSLGSLEAADAAAVGIQKALPDSEVVRKPIADGGEGFLDVLTEALEGERRTRRVTAPLGDCVECTYGIVRARKMAVIEMARAAGLTLVKKEKRNPLYTTTYGVGEVIRDAMEQGCRHFLVGIGGSATNDGGIGMLKALGFGLWDKKGNPVPNGALGLASLAHITEENVPDMLKECTFEIACDVGAPLCGPEGCSAVFGPQKGADEKMIKRMDAWMEQYALLAKKHYPDADPFAPGAGAAGGLGFAFLTFTNAVIKSGIEIVTEKTYLEDAIKDADVVVTGEGRLDAQSAMGKAPVGIAKLAKKYGKPVLALSGSIGESATKCNEQGIDAYFSILKTPVSSEEAMQVHTAKENLQDTAEQIFRLWATINHISSTD